MRVEVQQRLSSPALEAAQELGQKLFNLTSGTAPKFLVPLFSKSGHFLPS
jgi:hypothetical protein